MEDTYRSQFRLPQSLYEKLKASAEQSGRPLNTELVRRLEVSFATPEQPPDPRSVELLEQVLDYQRMVMALLLTLEEGVDLLEADTPRNVTGFINNAEDLARDVRNILKHYGKKI